jgi:hypothetical protein
MVSREIREQGLKFCLHETPGAYPLITQNTATLNTAMTDQIEHLMTESLTDLVAQNAESIKAALLESDDGKLTVNLNAKLTLIGPKLFAKCGLSYSRKWTDEVEGSADVDDNQTKLELA